MHVVQCLFPRLFAVQPPSSEIMLRLYVSGGLHFRIKPSFLIPAMAMCDAGDIGTIEVLSWHPDHECIATITQQHGVMTHSLDVVLSSPLVSGWTHGTFRILEKNFQDRSCILEITLDCTNENIPPFKAKWLLDKPCAALAQQ